MDGVLGIKIRRARKLVLKMLEHSMLLESLQGALLLGWSARESYRSLRHGS